MAKKKVMEACCGKKGFPTFAVILLVLAIIWIISDLGYIAASSVPWLPIVIGIIAIGMIMKHKHHGMAK
jgi:hypothetical protein